MDGCAVLGTIGSYEWNADVYGSLSFASHIASEIRSRSAVLHMAFTLRRLNSKINHSIQELHSIMEGKIPAGVKVSTEEITPERVDNAARMIRDLHYALSDIYTNAKRRRYTNNSLIAGPLNKLHENAQILLSISDWLFTAGQHAETEALFARSKQEQERGEVYDFSQIQ